MRQTVYPLGPQTNPYQYFDKERPQITHHGKHNRDHSAVFWTLQFLHLIVALGAVGLTVGLYGTVWNCGSDCKYYATNTFLSTSVARDNDGWAVVPDSPAAMPGTQSNNWPIAPYYSCMRQAEMGKQSCDNSTLDSYISCLNTRQETRTALASCTAFTSTFYTAWPTGDQFLSCL